METGSENKECMSWPEEPLVDTFVRYILDLDGQLFVFENVPARVNNLTGEQFFAPATVRRIQQIALASKEPARTIQTSVHDWSHAA
jgi:hypothetical protein